MSSAQRRVLVTGGAGFIGSHTVEALLARGWEPIVLDALSTGKASNLPAGIRLEVGSILDLDLVAHLAAGCRAILHLAAVVSVPMSIEEPLRANEVNVAGALSVLEAARRAGVRRVVLASSAAVYGTPPASVATAAADGRASSRSSIGPGPALEAAAPPSPDPNAPVLPLDETSPTVPLSPYGAHKLMGEHYGRLYSQLHGLEVVSLRYFNVFGPRQDPSSPYSGVLSRFADALAAGRPPTIHGDGRQTRDFVYVGDVARANVAALTAGPEVAGRVFNVAAGLSRSIREAFEVMRDVMGASIEPEFGPGRPGDIRHSAADVSRIREALAWRAENTFERGIRRLLGVPAPTR